MREKKQQKINTFGFFDKENCLLGNFLKYFIIKFFLLLRFQSM